MRNCCCTSAPANPVLTHHGRHSWQRFPPDPRHRNGSIFRHAVPRNPEDAGMTDSWLPEDPTEVIGEPEPSPSDTPTVATMPVRRKRSLTDWWLRLTARTSLGLVSVVVLGTTGYAWATYHTFNSDVTRSNAIAAAEGTTVHSLNGDTNILIMGLD